MSSDWPFPPATVPLFLTTPAPAPAPPSTRSSSAKPRCSGQWTEARFRQFVISQIRSATRKWQPRIEAKRRARRSRGLYECQACHQLVPHTLPGPRRRIPNVIVDHIKPVVDPTTGFVSWDEYIERTFCELDNLQVLCRACHATKTSEERVTRVAHRRYATSELDDHADDLSTSSDEEEPHG